MAKKANKRGDVDRFTSDGHGLSIGKPNAQTRKAVKAYNKKQTGKKKK